jgi:hypothetical protein
MDKILVLKKSAIGDDLKSQVDVSAAELRQGSDVLQELKDNSGEKESDSPFKEAAMPLFLEDSSDGDKGNGQDEKDETEE